MTEHTGLSPSKNTNSSPSSSISLFNSAMPSSWSVRYSNLSWKHVHLCVYMSHIVYVNSVLTFLSIFAYLSFSWANSGPTTFASGNADMASPIDKVCACDAHTSHSTGPRLLSQSTGMESGWLWCIHGIFCHDPHLSSEEHRLCAFSLERREPDLHCWVWPQACWIESGTGHWPFLHLPNQFSGSLFSISQYP